MRFYVPPTLQQDFTDSLKDLGTDASINLDPTNILKIRLDKINYKTRYGKVSSEDVAFAEFSSGLKLGDYLQFSNSTFIITQLKVEEFPKCFEFYPSICNGKITITRLTSQVIDDNGNIITPEGDNPITSELYCSVTTEGQEFKVVNGGIGVIPSNELVIEAQFNDSTKKIKIGDNFLWLDDKYQIISINFSQVSLDKLSGLLSFTGKKVVGNGS